MQTVHINLFGSASPLSFLLDSCDVDVGLLKHELSLRSGLSRADFRLIKGKSGRLLSDDCLLLSDICADQWAEYSVLLNIVGGKGGFGSMLRAQGGRMASKKTSNFDSCRDLSGRRLKTINEAKKLAELLESEPERKRLKREQLFKKIEKGLKEPERQIIRFDDLDYIKDHEEGVESIKAAVEKAALVPSRKRSDSDDEISEINSSSSSSSSPPLLANVKALKNIQAAAKPKAKNMSMWDQADSDDEE